MAKFSSSNVNSETILIIIVIVVAIIVVVYFLNKKQECFQSGFNPFQEQPSSCSSSQLDSIKQSKITDNNYNTSQGTNPVDCTRNDTCLWNQQYLFTCVQFANNQNTWQASHYSDEL